MSYEGLSKREKDEYDMNEKRKFLTVVLNRYFMLTDWILDWTAACMLTSFCLYYVLIARDMSWQKYRSQLDKYFYDVDNFMIIQAIALANEIFAEIVINFTAICIYP